jgi:RNA polymerase sigma-70 factor (ECF subfamily)
MDESTFEALYQETARPLWSYVQRVSGSATLADDILQETYYRFFRAPRMTMDRGQMKSYLYRIATNLLHDHWRGEKRERQFAETLNQSAVTNQPQPTDLTNLFQKLKPQERALLWLAYVEGNEHKEIARILGLKEKSIRVLLFRARKKLSSLFPQGQKSGEL